MVDDINANVTVNKTITLRQERVQEYGAERAALEREKMAARQAGGGGGRLAGGSMYAGGYAGPGEVDFGAENAKRAETEARKQNVSVLREENMVKQQNARVTAMEVRNQSMLSGSLLAVNMSLLGVMFGYQNLTRAINAENTAEIQRLGLKENKTKQDKERLKNLRKEQIEQQKMNTYLMAAISLTQFAMSIAQIFLAIKRQMAVATMMNAAATASESQANVVNATTAAAAGTANWYKTVTSTPWILLPMVVALMVGALAMGVGAYMLYKNKAAEGLMVNPRAGGTSVLMGEAGVPEIAAPVPMLERIVTERTREVIRSEGGAGGGRVINIFANDAQSFAESSWRTDDMLRRRGMS